MVTDDMPVQIDTLPLEEIVELFLNGHCASFAYAAWLAYGGRSDVGISVLIDDDGEPNFDLDEDEAPTRCAIHAYLAGPTLDLDAAGVATPEEMGDRYGLAAHSIDGPYRPDEFLQIFCCEDGPFEFDQHFVELAQATIPLLGLAQEV